MATELEIHFEFRNQRYRSALRGLQALGVKLDHSFESTAPVLKAQLRDFLDTVALALAKRHGNPYPSGTTAQTLSVRSGAGIASIRESVKVLGDTLSEIQGQIGGRMQLVIHEYGGTIRARNVTLLTIPLPAALNSDGTPKRASAREWDRTFVARSRKGNLLIFRRIGKRITPLYLLKPEVKIPPRLGMRKTLETGLPYFTEKAMDAMLDAILRNVDRPLEMA